MAGIKQTYALSIKDDASRVIASDTHIVTGDSEEEFNVTAPLSGNVSVPLTIAYATMVAFYVVSTKDVTMTVNDDGTPDLTVALVANVPYWWYDGLGTNPITADLTGASALKFTNAGAADATVRGAFLNTSV